MVNALVKSGIESTGAVHKALFSYTKASSYNYPHVNGTPLPVKSDNGVAISAKCATNRL